jgi:RNA 2',3'-cyclic 3'-phosphodiesterase
VPETAAPGAARPADWRLFVALPVPADVRRSLWAQLAPWRARHPQARWLAADTWHLTLLFLGAVPADRVPDAIALVDAVATATQGFEVGIGAGGGRDRRGEGVAWLAVDAGAGSVIALAEALAARCPADLTRGAPPSRTPSAHLTVARRVDQALIADLSAARLVRSESTWRADRLVLVRSHLEHEGARYQTLHEAPMYAPEQ